ncbi:MAG: hypothetical protein JO250_08385 [Armatimonadetes bacterium]|nr:hypothetical protein [Armatimonadota bacterium]
MTYHRSGSHAAISYVLKGTIFFADTRQVVRGYPRILPASDYTADRFAVVQERTFFRALRDGEVIVEKKEDGVNIRLYKHGDQYLFATRDVYDGGNPLVAAGIENVRALGIDYGAQARQLMDKLYPKAYGLADLGYTLCFEMLLPEMETIIPADQPDLILIDVLDPDFVFTDRLEKERIGEDYRLNLVRLHGRMQGGSEAGDVYKRLRALEFLAAREGVEGYVAKGRFEGSDQLFIKVKPAAVREAHRAFSAGDLQAVYEAVQEDFAPEYLHDGEFAEEAMLDYLGSHGRNARWQVQDFLGNLPPPAR